jgi:hypothetical protein
MVCELCGSNDFTKDGEMFVCDYCRTKYTVAEAQKMLVEGTVRVDRSHEAGNLITLASAALDNGNPAEAYEYASKALEIAPDNATAWLIKGKAAGWSSTLANFRIGEMLGAFRSAEKLSPESTRDALRRDCADVLNQVSVAIHNLSWEQTQQFIQLDNTWPEHISRCEQVVPALQVAHEWGGGRQPLDNIIVVASNLIQGIKFTQFDGTAAVRFLTPDYERKVQTLIDTTAAELRELDGTYTAPKPVAQKADGCFVVTATMGRESALPVVTLRAFRDQILTRYSGGRRFIGWYYKNGPQLAGVISNSQVLRAMSLVFVVLPSTALAWTVLKVRKLQA